MRRSILFLLLSFLALKAVGQINGTVSHGMTGAAVAGASVVVAETGAGTSTDAGGRFTVAGRGTITLIVSHVGFLPATRVVSASNAARQDFALLPVTVALGEVLIEQASMTGGLLGLRDAPGSTHLLTTRALAKFAQTDVGRALRSVPGVSIQEEDGFGLRPNIGLRGSGSDRSSKITLMEDGVLVAPAPYAASAAYYFPTIGRMSGIEVVKGSSQIRYGPFTTGGAINLLSTPIPTKASGHLTLLTGDSANRLVHAYAGNGGERFAFLFETHHQRSNGFKELDNGAGTGFDKNDYLGKVRFSTPKEARVQQSLLLKVSTTDEVSDETYLGLTSGDFGVTPLRRYAGSQQDKMTASQTQFLARHRIGSPDRLQAVTSLYATRFHRNWYKLDKVTTPAGVVGIGSLLDEPEAYGAAYALVSGSSDEGILSVKANNRDYASRGIQSDARATLGSHVLELGIRYHYDEMDRFQWVDDYRIQNQSMALVSPGTPGTDSNRIESAHALASYAQLLLTYGHLTVRPGVRVENVLQERVDFGKADPERAGSALTTRSNRTSAVLPGLALTWASSPYWTAFSGVHKGFAPPGITEGAEPESSLNYELGSRYNRGPASLESVVFVTDYGNLLGSDLAAIGGSGSTDQFNGGAALVKGLELSGGYNLGALTGWSFSLPASFAYTYTSGTFSRDFESSFEPWGDVLKGDELPYLARNQLNAGFAVEKDSWEVSLSLFWMGRMRTRAGQGPDDDGIRSHVTIDLALDVSISPGVTAFAVARNLTDEIYVAARRPAGLRPGMPRSVMAGLRAEF
ncbi:MAG: Fe(3+) dicitrate transport protein [Rhodothermales bacterium]|jgi:Fe(3+) dicitrate transport protein